MVDRVLMATILMAVAATGCHGRPEPFGPGERIALIGALERLRKSAADVRTGLEAKGALKTTVFRKLGTLPRRIEAARVCVRGAGSGLGEIHAAMTAMLLEAHACKREGMMAAGAAAVDRFEAARKACEAKKREIRKRQQALGGALDRGTALGAPSAAALTGPRRRAAEPILKPVLTAKDASRRIATMRKCAAALSELSRIPAPPKLDPDEEGKWARISRWLELCGKRLLRLATRWERALAGKHGLRSLRSYNLRFHRLITSLLAECEKAHERFAASRARTKTAKNSIRNIN